MGYYTEYHIKMKYASDELQRLASDELAELLEIEGTEEPFGYFCYDRYKWYECVSDMIKISSHYPNATFVVDGAGEDYDDIWRAFFHDGECVLHTFDREIDFPGIPPGWIPDK